jgi:hypothetical protein
MKKQFIIGTTVLWLFSGLTNVHATQPIKQEKTILTSSKILSSYTTSSTSTTASTSNLNTSKMLFELYDFHNELNFLAEDIKYFEAELKMNFDDYTSRDFTFKVSKSYYSGIHRDLNSLIKKGKTLTSNYKGKKGYTTWDTTNINIQLKSLGDSIVYMERRVDSLKEYERTLSTSYIDYYVEDYGYYLDVISAYDAKKKTIFQAYKKRILALK